MGKLIRFNDENGQTYRIDEAEIIGFVERDETLVGNLRSRSVLLKGGGEIMVGKEGAAMIDEVIKRREDSTP